jgi:hypothetical protein
MSDRGKLNNKGFERAGPHWDLFFEAGYEVFPQRLFRCCLPDLKAQR